MKINKKLFSLVVLLISSLLFAETEGMELVDQSILSTLLGAFTAGLLLTFTPCVLPMMPILSSIIAGQGKDISKTKAFGLSLSYVLGTATSYAVMGALAGATGEQLQSYFQNIYFIGGVSFVFVLMAISMFGLFTIELPSFIQSKLNKESQGFKGGAFLSVYFIGVFTALILGACVSPILIAFLSIAITTADPYLGASTMFFMALGMGVPLILLGLGAGHLIPKAGEWMDKVKYTFGVLLLGVAIYTFGTLDLFSPLLLWGSLLVGLSIYIGGAKSLEVDASGWKKLSKAVATVILIWGIFLLIGGAFGEKDPLKPLARIVNMSVENSDTVTEEKGKFIFETVKNLEDLEAKLEQASAEDKLVIIYFYTDTCPVCKKLKASTLIDAEVLSALEKNYVALQVNISDKKDLASQEIKKKYSVFGPPSFVFFAKDGKELKDYMLYGYLSASQFLDTLELHADE